jgi:hypothetical protein
MEISPFKKDVTLKSGSQHSSGDQQCATQSNKMCGAFFIEHKQEKEESFGLLFSLR